jgi:hypothetical protein
MCAGILRGGGRTVHPIPASVVLVHREQELRMKESKGIALEGTTSCQALPQEGGLSKLFMQVSRCFCGGGTAGRPSLFCVHCGRGAAVHAVDAGVAVWRLPLLWLLMCLCSRTAQQAVRFVCCNIKGMGVADFYMHGVVNPHDADTIV